MDAEWTGARLAVEALREGRAPAGGLPHDLSDAQIEAALTVARDSKILSRVGAHFGTNPRSRAVILANAANTMSRNTALLMETLAIYKALNKARISIVVIKGPAQQHVLHGTFFIRAATDIDIIVNRTDFNSASQALAALGYRRVTPSLWWREVLGEEHFERRGEVRFAVDLHHAVGQPGIPGRLAARHLVGERAEIEFGGGTFPTLGRENALLMSAISAAKAIYNRESSAAYLCDIAAGLMPDAPQAVSLLLTNARRLGAGGLATVTLRFASALFGPTFYVPPEVGRVLADVPDQQLIDMVLLSGAPQTRWIKRRRLMWEFCSHRPLVYARELIMLARSEAVRRVFERGTALSAHLD